MWFYVVAGMLSFVAYMGMQRRDKGGNVFKTYEQKLS